MKTEDELRDAGGVFYRDNQTGLCRVAGTVYELVPGKGYEIKGDNDDSVRTRPTDSDRSGSGPAKTKRKKADVLDDGDELA